jgi:hypothetical protein
VRGGQQRRPLSETVAELRRRWYSCSGAQASPEMSFLHRNLACSGGSLSHGRRDLLECGGWLAAMRCDAGGAAMRSLPARCTCMLQVQAVPEHNG